MAYSTVSGVRLAVAPGDYDATQVPGDVTNTCADLSNAQLIDAIAQADAFIDASISSRYATPVAAVAGATPHPIDFWSRTIAVYLATLTRRKNADFADTDPVFRRFQLVRNALDHVASARSTLPIPALTVGDGVASGAGAPINQHVGSLFTPDDWLSGATFAGTGSGTTQTPYWQRRVY